MIVINKTKFQTVIKAMVKIDVIIIISKCKILLLLKFASNNACSATDRFCARVYSSRNFFPADLISANDGLFYDALWTTSLSWVLLIIRKRLFSNVSVRCILCGSIFFVYNNYVQPFIVISLLIFVPDNVCCVSSPYLQ